jgi:hypothetical protein
MRIVMGIGLAGLVIAGTAGAETVSLTLEDGSTLRGELVHRYDRRIWFRHPADESVLAVFHDGIVSLVSERKVVGRDVCAAPATPSFAQSLRDGGIYLRRLPVEGIWYVAEGASGFHPREDGWGDFAWDLVKLDAAGQPFRGRGDANADYYAWDQEVRLPNAGVVTGVVRDQANGDPTRDLYGPGNAVYVRIAPHWILAFLHLRHGSIPSTVGPGARLEAGALIGHVGNSGTRAPHLHLSLLYADLARTGRSWGMPAEIEELWVKRPAEARANRRTWAQPARGDLVSNQRFEWKHVHPADGWEGLSCR